LVSALPVRYLRELGKCSHSNINVKFGTPETEIGLEITHIQRI
jgi:hypothetical protein